MSDNKQINDDDLSSWEQHASRDLMTEDLEGIYLNNKERIMQNLYGHFQGIAQCIAVLYKGVYLYYLKLCIYYYFNVLKNTLNYQI